MLIRSSAKPVKAVIWVHGLLGFGVVQFLGCNVAYFRNVANAFRKLGCPMYFPRLPLVGAVEERAAVLARFLSRVKADELQLVAHSMGGLDARFVIHALDPDGRIRQLVTIATPHRGTPLATWMLAQRKLPPEGLRQFLGPALRDLTPSASKHFNRQINDRPGVQYESYGGARPVREMPALLRPWAARMAREAGANDGYVPLHSTRWGTRWQTVRADHLELAGWSIGLPRRRFARPFDHIGFYRCIVHRLALPA